MMRKIYVHQKENWPQFTWDEKAIASQLGAVRHLQGIMIGKMQYLGFDMKGEAMLRTMTLDVLKSSEIEGELLDSAQVRSSLARKLGMDIGGLVASDRNVDGVVDMLLDATQHFGQPLTKERLFAWHSSLFPSGRSGMHQILVAQWRDDSTGPMQVVSGALGKEKVHFEAPTASLLENEMQQFLTWFNANQGLDAVVKAGVAHFWFVTVHPFEDGNGRIARAITDMLLAQSDGISERFYSMSAQIREQRKEYYNTLERLQKGTVDITPWLTWFIACLKDALHAADDVLALVMTKHHFWTNHATTVFNERQVLMLNKLLDGFDGKLTTSKWAKITKCSQDTALRDIQVLMKKGVLQQEASGGRSTNYELVAVEQR